MTYADKLKDPRWQKKRLEVFNRDEWKCIMCKDDTTTLHVHHFEYSGNPWEAEMESLATLCHHCHKMVEHSKKGDINIISAAKFSIEDKKVGYHISKRDDGGLLITEFNGDEMNIVCNLDLQSLKDLINE